MALSPAEKTILANQMDVLRYGDATAKELILILGQAQDETITLLQGIGSADLPITRLHAQITLQQTSGTLSIMAEKYHDVITDGQAAIIANEFETVTKALIKEVGESRAVPDVFPKLPVERIRVIIEQPIGGKPLGDWVSSNLGHLEKDIRRSLGTAVARGEGTAQASDRLREAFGMSRKGATVIARTSMLAAAHTAREEVYDRFDSLIKSYTFLATLDSRTCPVCGPWDGVTKATRGELPSVPIHPQCRCVIRPNTRFADYDSLKRPAVVAVEKKVTHHKDGSSTTAFKPVGVKHVPGGTTYEEFFKSQPERWQREVLGKTRFELWKSGKIHLKDLTAATDNRLLSLKALKAKIARGSLVESWPPTETFKDAVTLAIRKQAVVSYTAEELAGWSVGDIHKIAKATGVIPEAGKWAKEPLIEALTTTNLRRFNHLLKEEGGKALAKAEKYAAAAKAKQADIVKPHITPGELKKAGLGDSADDLAKHLGGYEELRKLAEQMGFADNWHLGIEDAAKFLTTNNKSVRLGLIAKGAEAKAATEKAAAELAAKIAELDKKKPLLPPETLGELKKLIVTGAQAKKVFLEAAGSAVPKGLVNVAKKQDLIALGKSTSKAEFETIIEKLKGAEQEKKAAISAKLKANAAAKKAQKEAGNAPAPPAKPATVAVVEDTVVSVEPPALSFAAVDEVWESVVKDPDSFFRYQGVARVGGAHGSKHFYTDPQGQRWLFKGQPSAWKDYVTEAEEASYRIKRLFFPDLTPEVRVITMPGRGRGTIQRWVDDSGENLRGIDVRTMSARELQQLQEEHVIDWLISNHDSHTGQFHRLPDGRLLAVDKGQAFKFFGRDRLSPSYNPNRGFEVPIYEDLAKAMQRGDLKIDPQVTLRMIERVERISDEEFLAATARYAKGFEGPGGEAGFGRLLLERKHNLRRDFEAWYEEALGVKGFRFKPPANAAVPARAFPAVTRQIDEAVARKAQSMKARGYSIQVDVDDIEDLTVLIGQEIDDKGQPVTTLTLKLLPTASPRVELSLMGKATSEVKDIYFNQFLPHVKSVSLRIARGDSIKPETVAFLQEKRKELASIAKTALDENNRQLASHYLQWTDEIEKSIASRQGPIWGGRTMQPYRPPSTLLEGRAENIVDAQWRTFSWRNGKAGTIEETSGLRKISQTLNIADTGDHQIVATTRSGAEITFVPWKTVNEQTTVYALQGRATVRIPGAATPQRINEALDELKALGIKTDLADPDYVEYLYLMRHAYQRGIDRNAPYRKIADMANGRARNDALAEQLAKDLGTDIRTSPDYNPQGAYAKGIRQGDEVGGHRLYYRADFSDADAVDVLNGGYVYHKSTATPLPELVDRLAKGNQALASNSHKVWIHLDPNGGMSPEEDLRTGGAAYVFTRLRKLGEDSHHPGLYFHPRVMRRLDAAWVNRDVYGRAFGDERRKLMTNDLRTIKNMHLQANNEIVFKDVLPLDQLEYVVVNSAQERDQVLAAFKNNGITHLPNGRPVDKVIWVRRSPPASTPR